MLMILFSTHLEQISNIFVQTQYKYRPISVIAVQTYPKCLKSTNPQIKS